MLAHVVVVPSRLYGLTAPDGAVELTPAPAGSRMVEVWHEKGGRSSAMVEVATAGVTSLALTLDASSWRETRHLNKYGKPYPPPDDDETRY
jgi:hypothetical protein